MSERSSTYSRSISQLKTFTRCGEAYNLERIHRSELPKRPAPWTLMGIAVHDAIMTWELNHRNISLTDQFKLVYDLEVAKAWADQPDPKLWYLPPMAKYVNKVISNYRDRGIAQIETYREMAEKATWEALFLEQPFEYDFDGIIVKGAVDRVLYFPGDEMYLVEDLKSGSPKDEEDHRQLDLYAFIMRELYDVPVYYGRYWFTKLNRPSVEYFSDKNKKFWVETFKKLDTAINSGLFLPSPGEKCGLCSVKPWCSSQGWLQIGEKL